MTRKTTSNKKNKRWMPMAASAAAVAMAVSPLANTGVGETIFNTKQVHAFSGGTGSIQDPYLINNANEFRLIESMPSAHYKLVNDIDFNNGSLYIEGFYGTLDGNGYTVRNIRMSSGTGLFGLVDALAEIKNINFENFNITNLGNKTPDNRTFKHLSKAPALAQYHFSASVAGGGGLIMILAGKLQNVTATNFNVSVVDSSSSSNYGTLVGKMETGVSKFENIIIKNSKLISKSTSGSKYGGAIGYVFGPTSYPSRVKNVYVDVDIEATNSSNLSGVGMLAGEARHSNLSNIYVKGKIKSSSYKIGGIVGVDGSNLTVKNVISDLNLLQQTNASTTTNRAYGIGGIIGQTVHSTTTIQGGVVLGSLVSGGSTSGLSRKTSKGIGTKEGTSKKETYALTGSLGDILSGETIITDGQSKSKAFYESIGFDFTEDWGINDGQSKPFLLYSLSDTERESYLQQQNQGKYDEATTAVEKAESTKSTTDITMARNLVNALPNGTVKTNLTNRLNTLEKDMKYQTVLVAVEKAEETFNAGNLAQAQTDKNVAQGLVDALGADESRKQDLQVRLDALQTQIDDAKQALAEKEAKYNQALAAVTKAEGSFNGGNVAQAQTDKNVAQGLVTALGSDETRKQGLQVRLDALQNQIDDAKQALAEKEANYNEALAAVGKAEGSFNGGNLTQAQTDKNVAQGLVTALGADESRKQGLQVRLDALQTQIDDAKAAELAQVEKEAKYNEALVAVTKAEGSFSTGDHALAQLDKDVAQALVNGLGADESRKQNLQDRLDALQTQIDDAKAAEQEQAENELKYNEALAAVVKAEGSFNNGDYTQAQLDKNAAQTLVNALGADESRKSALQDRLDALQTQIDDAKTAEQEQADKDEKYNEALQAVSKAEGSFNGGDYEQAQLDKDVAQDLVNAFGSDEPRKQNLQDRLDVLQQQLTDVASQTLTNAPTNLTVVADSPKQVTINFDAVPHATEYVIKRNGVIVAYVDEPTYVDTNVNHNQTYTYEVAARNTNSTSPTVTGQIQTPVQYHEVHLTWPTVQDIEKYVIERDGEVIGETVDTSFTDKEAIEGETYQYNIIAVNEAVGFALSNLMQPFEITESVSKEFDKFPTDTTEESDEPTNEVPKVQNIQATQQAEQVNVTWDAFDKANRYRVQIYVYDDLTGEYVREGFGRVTTSNFISFDTLKEGRTYKFEVVPQTNKYLNESANESAPITLAVTPPPVVVPPAETYNFKVTVNGTTADLTWDEMTDATRYRVQLYVQNDAGLFVKKGPSRAIAETTASFENLDANQTYKFVVEPRIGYTYKLDEALEATATIQAAEPELPVVDSNQTIRNIQVEMLGKQAELSWDGAQIDGTDITTYRVVRYVKDDLTGQYKHDGLTRAVTGTTYTDTYKLISGKTYQYEIIPRVGYKYDETYKTIISDVINDVE